MSKATSPVDNLDPIIIKWLYRQGWTNLHDVQERAIAPILDGSRDVIISAATASGKTEAAFLPACSKILKSNTLDSVQIIYISPINLTSYYLLKDLASYHKINFINTPSMLQKFTTQNYTLNIEDHKTIASNIFNNIVSTWKIEY